MRSSARSRNSRQKIESAKGTWPIPKGEVPQGVRFMMSMSKATASESRATGIYWAATPSDVKLVLTRGTQVPIDAAELVRAVAPQFRGKGGGKPDFAEASFPNLEMARGERKAVLPWSGAPDCRAPSADPVLLPGGGHRDDRGNRCRPRHPLHHRLVSGESRARARRRDGPALRRGRPWDRRRPLADWHPADLTPAPFNTREEWLAG